MNFFINKIISNYNYSFIFLALIFFIMAKQNAQILLSVIIVSFIYISIDNNIKNNISEKNDKKNKIEESLTNYIKNIEQINVENLYTFYNKNKNVRFLVDNKKFINIIYNIRFIKKFDKTRYNKIIINMNKMIKIYIYILSGRYEINTYLPIFYDIKDTILEIFYSLIFVIPQRFKHIYGFVPHDEIEKSLNDFIDKYNKMLSIIINYGNVEKKYAHINYEKYKPFEKNKEAYLP
uniref:Uncharacterized protein n=1 Tax=Virus NIOZ-UU159 TaxID=2763270 RepID=A0A7S9XH95_9VIRU|nr:MAG: hypothetical protein NIOZUU159_00399 [Virus NIOZ-UU159]